MADSDTRKGKIAQFNREQAEREKSNQDLAHMEQEQSTIPRAVNYVVGETPVPQAKVDKNATAAEQIAQHNRPETEGEKLKRTQAEEQIRLKQQADAKHLVIQGTQAAVDSVNSTIDPWKEWVAAQPTPGGILALLAFIIFFAFAVIPVNDKGQTRLYLLWQSILGRTHLLYSETPNATVQYGGGASGDFAASGAAHGEAGSTNNVLPAVDLTHLNIFGL